MSIRERLSGNEAIATAMKQINPDVVAAFPITPSTEIPQYFSTFVANGKVDIFTTHQQNISNIKKTETKPKKKKETFPSNQGNLF